MDERTPDMKRWYMTSRTFNAFQNMKKEFEKRRKLLSELSQDEFATVFVKHRKQVLDVLVDAELALSIAGEDPQVVSA